MTAFFGCFASEDPAVDLSRMAVATNALPLQPLQITVLPPIAVAGRSLWPGECVIESAPQDAIAVGAVSLTNRSELQSRLGLSQSSERSDLAIVAAAYVRWGWQCVHHIEGDWSFALWDARNRELVLARDATGTSGMFWWHERGSVVFGNHLGAVLAHPCVSSTPDERVIAGLLTVFDDPELEESTCYRDVKALQPGVVMRFRGHELKRECWWNPDGPELRFKSDAECNEAFVALYRDAVRDSLRAPTGVGKGIALSSGLDSNSVMALASPELARRGERLRGYVHRPTFAPAELTRGLIHDEFDLAAEAAAFVGGVDVVGLRGGGLPFIDSLAQSLVLHAQPTSAGNFHWLDELLRTACRDGCGVLLTGQGGNGTVSWTGSGNLWPLIRRGRWGKAIDQLRRSKLPLARAVRLQLLSPLRQRWRLYQRGLPQPPIAWGEYAFIHPDLAHRIQLQERMREVRHDVALGFPFSPQQIQTLRRNMSLGGQVASRWLDLGNAYGLSVRDPTRDKRVVEFCWRLADEHFWGDASQRMLIRGGLKGLLPHSILRNPTRGAQSADLIAKARLDSQAIDALIDGFEARKLNWVDVKLLRKCHQELQQKQSFSTYEVLSSHMVPALSVMLFAENISRI